MEHPEGKICLLSGFELTCYEKQGVASPHMSKEEEQRQCLLFTSNAFRLLAHRERILSDSRMFLCPVAVSSGLMYSGHSGFLAPTLGIYLEWWQECPGTMTLKGGVRSLVYRLAGSPLSGANWCKSVDENGVIHEAKLTPFANYWRPLMGINTRYNAAKQRYGAYSLAQVLEILNRETQQ